MNHLHRPGELITIRWPGAPYDFKIQFQYADKVNAPGWESWVVLHGLVVEPHGPQHQAYRGFYCHPIGDREYEMIPKRD
jgi:hypothetical protein